MVPVASMPRTRGKVTPGDELRAVQPERLDPDQHLARRRPGDGSALDGQHLRATGAVHHHGAHGVGHGVTSPGSGAGLQVNRWNPIKY